MTFKNTDTGRKLISGQMIDRGIVYMIRDYMVFHNKEGENIAYAKCTYKI